jgi:hypothetical protein
MQSFQWGLKSAIIKTCKETNTSKSEICSHYCFNFFNIVWKMKLAVLKNNTLERNEIL